MEISHLRHQQTKENFLDLLLISIYLTKNYYYLQKIMLVIITSYQQHSLLYQVRNGMKMKYLVTFALYTKIDPLKSIKSQIINTDMKSCIYEVS